MTKTDDLRAVLSAVQDERDTLKEAYTHMRGQNAMLTRDLEAAREDLREVRDALLDAEAEVIAATEDLRAYREEGCAELVEALDDRDRLLRMLGLTDHEWALQRDSLACAIA
jgi:soluble cytochrome b562